MSLLTALVLIGWFGVVVWVMIVAKEMDDDVRDD